MRADDFLGPLRGCHSRSQAPSWLQMVSRSLFVLMRVLSPSFHFAVSGIGSICGPNLGSIIRTHFWPPQVKPDSLASLGGPKMGPYYGPQIGATNRPHSGPVLVFFFCPINGTGCEAFFGICEPPFAFLHALSGLYFLARRGSPLAVSGAFRRRLIFSIFLRYFGIVEPPLAYIALPGLYFWSSFACFLGVFGSSCFSALSSWLSSCSLFRAFFDVDSFFLVFYEVFWHFGHLLPTLLSPVFILLKLLTKTTRESKFHKNGRGQFWQVSVFPNLRGVGGVKI